MGQLETPRAEREILGRIISVRVDGVIDTQVPGEFVRDEAAKITYDIALFGDDEINYLENEPPARRPFQNIKIISASIGDPCSVTISDDMNGSIYRSAFIREDIDWHDCDLNPLFTGIP